MEKKQQMTEAQRLQQVDAAEREKHNQIIGQLKAAEARNRLRIMRTSFLRYRLTNDNKSVDMVDFKDWLAIWCA